MSKLLSRQVKLRNWLFVEPRHSPRLTKGQMTHARVLAEGALTPWGSLVPPKHKPANEQNGDLSKSEMTKYVNALLPDERDSVSMARKEYHKKLSLLIRKSDWKKYEALIDSFRTSNISLDEVSFTLLFNGSLLSPDGGTSLASSLIAEMKSSECIHPSLLRIHEAFLSSLKDLEAFDAYPNNLNLRKSLKPLWEISAEFKRMRMRAFRAFVVAERPELPPAQLSAFWGKRDDIKRKNNFAKDTLTRLTSIERKGGLGWLSNHKKKRYSLIEFKLI